MVKRQNRVNDPASNAPRPSGGNRTDSITSAPWRQGAAGCGRIPGLYRPPACNKPENGERPPRCQRRTLEDDHHEIDHSPKITASVKGPNVQRAFLFPRLYPSALSPAPNGIHQAGRVLTNTRNPHRGISHAINSAAALRRA